MLDERPHNSSEYPLEGMARLRRISPRAIKTATRKLQNTKRFKQSKCCNLRRPRRDKGTQGGCCQQYRNSVATSHLESNMVERFQIFIVAGIVCACVCYKQPFLVRRASCPLITTQTPFSLVRVVTRSSQYNLHVVAILAEA